MVEYVLQSSVFYLSFSLKFFFCFYLCFFGPDVTINIRIFIQYFIYSKRCINILTKLSIAITAWYNLAIFIFARPLCCDFQFIVFKGQKNHWDRECILNKNILNIIWAIPHSAWRWLFPNFLISFIISIFSGINGKSKKSQQLFCLFWRPLYKILCCLV